MKKLLSILLLSGTIAFTGCGNDREDFVLTNTNNVAIAAPVCADDAYATNSNTPLTVNAATGVLTNDTPNGATVTFQTTSANGGTVTGAQDGSFVYVPAQNFAGSDSFTYTLGNSGGVVTCTVTVTVTAVNGFFVDAANGSDATGNFTNGQPFATIQAAAAAAPAGSDIVVRPGNYTGGINLEDGDRLLGSGSVLAQGVVRPTLTGPVVLGDGCTVGFVRIENSPGLGIDGDGQANGTVTNCEVVNSAGTAGIQVRPGTGIWDVSNNTLTNNQQIGITFQTIGAGTMTATVNNNDITGSGSSGLGFVSENTSQCTAIVTNNVMTGNQAGATLEAFAFGASTLCLDLENNQNNDVYVLSSAAPGSALNVEELNELTNPAFANNTGAVQIDVGAPFNPPNNLNDGDCTP